MDIRSRSVISFYGVSYSIDLIRCRVAMLSRLEALRREGKEGSGRSLVAEAAGVDKVTFANFLRGRQVRPENLVAIITRGLGLELADVAKPISDEVAV